MFDVLVMLVLCCLSFFVGYSSVTVTVTDTQMIAAQSRCVENGGLAKIVVGDKTFVVCKNDATFELKELR